MATHETYFRKYKLSVEQYGEILTAQAFHGKKMPGGNRGFDVQSTVGRREMRIEVKSKLAVTKGGTAKANVVRCSTNKFLPNAMTHLVVVLVDPDEARPSVKEAWLLTRQQAANLKRRRKTYINVGDLRRAKGKRIVTKKLQRAAKTQI